MNIVKGRIEWDSLLKEEFCEYADVYFKYEYFELYKRHYNVEPETIFWEDKNLKIFWTHLIRDISKIEQFKDFKYYDLTTPYGYGGPLTITKTEDEEKINKSLKIFFEEYKEYALKNNYVCEFIRFHPIFENWKFFNRILEIEYLNDVVIVDLAKDLEEIWKNMNKVTRRYIRKSQKEFENIVINDDPTDKEIKIFVSLYLETMKKQNATKKYLFSYEFVKDHFDLLKSLLLYCQNKSNEIGSSAIFLKGTNLLHYHLGSTNYNFKTSPLRLSLWEAIKWAKENDFKLLLLGGGRGRNDSLFEFKRGFSKDIIPFYIGKKVFDVKAYQALLTVNPMPKTSDEYFPAYRQGLDKKIV